MINPEYDDTELYEFLSENGFSDCDLRWLPVMRSDGSPHGREICMLVCKTKEDAVVKTLTYGPDLVAWNDVEFTLYFTPVITWEEAFAEIEEYIID